MDLKDLDIQQLRLLASLYDYSTRRSTTKNELISLLEGEDISAQELVRLGVISNLALPYEILREIYFNVPAQTILNQCRTSSQVHRICRDPSFWQRKIDLNWITLQNTAQLTYGDFIKLKLDILLMIYQTFKLGTQLNQYRELLSLSYDRDRDDSKWSVEHLVKHAIRDQNLTIALSLLKQYPQVQANEVFLIPQRNSQALINLLRWYGDNFDITPYDVGYIFSALKIYQKELLNNEVVDVIITIFGDKDRLFRQLYAYGTTPLAYYIKENYGVSDQAIASTIMDHYCDLKVFNAYKEQIDPLIEGQDVVTIENTIRKCPRVVKQYILSKK